jgi:transcriptional regulator with XRE-family HTH domain
VISGTEIAAARQRAGLSQKGLADVLGTDIKTVNNWETGRTKPRQLEAIRTFIQLHPPEGVAPLALVSDEELLREIAERFARARTKGDMGDGNYLDQKISQTGSMPTQAAESHPVELSDEEVTPPRPEEDRPGS